MHRPRRQGHLPAHGCHLMPRSAGTIVYQSLNGPSLVRDSAEGESSVQTLSQPNLPDEEIRSHSVEHGFRRVSLSERLWMRSV